MQDNIIMRERLIVQTSLLIAFILLVGLTKNWLSLSYLPFLYGALIGALMPMLDHLVYVYGLHPEELTSQRVRAYFSKGNIVAGTNLLMTSFSERTKLILHTAHFQIIFVIVSFLIVSSGASVFGRGVVLAFLLHLVVDQIIELNDKGNIDGWFSVLPITLTKTQQIWYVAANSVALFVFGLLL